MFPETRTPRPERENTNVQQRKSSITKPLRIEKSKPGIVTRLTTHSIDLVEGGNEGGVASSGSKGSSRVGSL